MNQWELEANLTRNRRPARENAISFGFVCDWLSSLGKYFKPIQELIKQGV